MRKKISMYLFALLIFFTLLIGNLVFIFYDTGFVQEQFETLHKADFDVACGMDSKIRGFILGDTNEFSYDLLSDKEFEHLKDVKKLFTLAKILLGLCAFILVIFLFDFRFPDFSYIGIYVGLYTIFFVFMSFLALQNFETSFDLFHNLFFAGDLWKMSGTDLLVSVYPSDFFFSAASAVFRRTVLFAFFISLVLNLGYFRELFRNLKKDFKSLKK
ncbi:MAG: DUF1461 domain-containing protein [Nanobdellota archaeon]